MGKRENMIGKKLTQEEIEVRNNIRLNKELMATLTNDAMTDF